MLVGACVRATLTTASTQARSHNSVSFGQRLTAGGQYCVLYSTSDLKRGDLPREVSMGKMRGLGELLVSERQSRHLLESRLP